MLGFTTKRPHRPISACAIVLLVLLFSPVRLARAEESGPKAVILILERLELRDITPDKTPNLHALLRQNGAGLTALKKAFNYRNVPSAFYATVGAGASAAGFESGVSGERMSRSARARSIENINQERDTQASFGAAADVLHANGLRTAAVGSTGRHDFLDTIMDRRGRIDRVTIDNGRVPPSGGGAVTNIAGFTEAVRESYKDSALTVAAYEDIQSGPRRAQDMARADAIAGRVVESISDDDLLIILMPFSGAPVRHAPTGNLIAKGEPLSPILIKGPDVRGLLSSGTTRRLGVVSATDIMPTVVNHLGIQAPDAFRGRVIESRTSNAAVPEYLNGIAETAWRHEAFRLPILAPAIIFGIVVLLLALVLIWRRVKLNDLAARALVLSVFLLPPAFSLPLLVGARTPLWGLAVIGAALLASLPLVAVSRNKLTPLLVVSTLTPTLFIADIFFGGPLGDLSLIGGSLLTGGRYYGVGNPLFGMLFIFTVLLAVSLTLMWPAISKRASYKIGLAAGMALVLAVVGAPDLGANFGGLLTLAIAWPFLYFRLIGQKAPWRVLALMGLSIGFILFLVVYDAGLGKTGQSHIGRTLGLLGSNPLASLSIIKAKLGYNIEIVFLVLFKWGGIAAAALIAGLIYAVRLPLSTTLRKFPVFKRVLPGIFAGAVVSLLVNDTGFQPLAIIFLYTLATAVYLHLSAESHTLETAPEKNSSGTNNERMFA